MAKRNTPPKARKNVGTESDRSGRKKALGAKAIRDQVILEKALSGKTTKAIAQELDIHRQRVSEVLNSQEMKKRISEIDQKLMACLDDAIETIKREVKVNWIAARAVIQNFGSLSPRINVNHSHVTLEELLAGTEESNSEIEEERSNEQQTKGK